MDTNRLPARIARVSAVVATVMGAWLFLLHVRMVVSPAPQEMREGAAIWITRLLLEGRNPYALVELPAGTNVYGIFYHLAVLPLAMVFGNGFAVHRLISGLSIVGACVLMYRLLRREEADRLIAWVGTLLFYVSCMYFVGPLARPDGLGVLLSMASLTLVSRKTATPQALLAGLGFALLALLTKTLLAYPPLVVAAYSALFVSGARGIAYGVAGGLSMVTLLGGMNHFYPAYVTLSIAANAQSGYRDAAHLFEQTSDWLLFSLPLTVGVIFAGVRGVERIRARADWRRAPSIFAFASVANACVFFYWLGWHPGAHMTYLFQIVTPVLAPALLPAVSNRRWSRACVALALPVCMAASAHYFPLSFGRFADAEATFARVDRAIASHRDVLGSTEVAGLLALRGRPVVDSGQSQYFTEAIGDSVIPGTLPAAALRERWRKMFDRMQGDLQARRFDLVVRSRRNGLIPQELAADDYRIVDTVSLAFAWAGQSWPVDLWVRQGQQEDSRR